MDSVNKSNADVWKKLIFFGRVYAESGLLSIHLWINVKLPALKNVDSDLQQAVLRGGEQTGQLWITWLWVVQTHVSKAVFKKT